jgi:hypothetical protein
MREIRQSGSVRGVRRNPYPYRDFLRDLQFGEASARTAGHQPDVVGNFVEGHRQSAKCSRELDQRIVCALNRKLVRCANKWKVRKCRNFGSGFVTEVRSCIDPISYGCPAQREEIYALQRIVYTLEIIAQHTQVSRPFLSERDRCCVLHMRAPNLDDVLPGLDLRGDRIVQLFHCGHKPLPSIYSRRNVHRSRESVVGRLRHVDVVIGMNW